MLDLALRVSKPARSSFVRPTVLSLKLASDSMPSIRPSCRRLSGEVKGRSKQSVCSWAAVVPLCSSLSLRSASSASRRACDCEADQLVRKPLVSSSTGSNGRGLAFRSPLRKTLQLTSKLSRKALTEVLEVGRLSSPMSEKRSA